MIDDSKRNACAPLILEGTACFKSLATSLRLLNLTAESSMGRGKNEANVGVRGAPIIDTGAQRRRLTPNAGVLFGARTA